MGLSCRSETRRQRVRGEGYWLRARQDFTPSFTDALTVVWPRTEGVWQLFKSGRGNILIDKVGLRPVVFNGKDVEAHLLDQELQYAVFHPEELMGAMGGLSQRDDAGVADDILTTLVLAVTCPVVVAPAMNENMYANPAVRDNISLLKKRGIEIIEPEAGRLACGTEGLGRLAGPSKIIEVVHRALARSAK